MDSKLFDAALTQAATTWKTYAKAICVLALAFLIDALSGFSFFFKGETIDLFGTKVVRETLSATYGILFSVFVGTVFLESRLLKYRLAAFDASTSGASSVLDLWLLSPFSQSKWLRAAFWALFIDGFCCLAVFSWVHLFCHRLPLRHGMTPALYVAIGAVDALLLVVTAPFGYWTYQNLQQVKSKLSQHDKRI